MLATLACLATREQNLALTARPPDALPGLPVVEVLATCLRWPFKDDLLRGRVPVGDDGRLLGPLLDDSRPLLAALLLLGLGALRGHTRALLAARVLALGALLAQAKRGAAEMALPVHTHPNGLLHTKSMALSRVPFTGLQLQAVHLANLLCALGEDLRSRNFGGFHSCRDFGSRGRLGGFAVASG